MFSRRQARDAGFTVKDIELHISADVTDRPAYVLSTIRATVGW